MKGEYKIKINLNPVIKEKLDKIPWGLKRRLLSYIVESTLEKRSIEELLSEMLTLPSKPSKEPEQEPEQKFNRAKVQKREIEDKKPQQGPSKQTEPESRKSKEDEFFEKIEKTFEDWL